MPAWIELGALLRRDGRAADALEPLAVALDLAPQSPIALLEGGRVEMALGREDEALGLLDASIACGDSVPARLAKASLLVRARMTALAEADVRAALVLDPASATAHGALGRVLYYTKRYREAAAEYSEGERLGLRDPAFLLEHGHALESAGDLALASEVYRHGAEWFPGDPRPHRRLGATLLALNRPAEAIAPLEVAARLDPSEAETHHKLGTALARTGRQPEALAALKEAVRLDPELAPAYYEIGTLLADLGRDAEAQAALDRFHALQESRDRADHTEGKIGTLNREGLRLYREGRAGEAIGVYEEAIRLGPKNGAVHANLGLALLAAGDPGGAARAFREAIARDGPTPALQELLEEALRAESAPAPAPAR